MHRGKNKILITGANGFVGTKLSNYLAYRDIAITSLNENNYLSHKVIKCDLSKKTEVRDLIKKISPNTIIHLAALTNPKRNELNPEKAKSLNSGITKNLIESIDRDNIKLIFLSTDKIFNGEDEFPNEDSQPNPIGVYGKEKLACEKMIRREIKKHFIIRIPIIHSNGVQNDYSFIDKALILIKNGEKVKAFENIVRCYVRLHELFQLINILLDNNKYGTFNAGSEAMSYYKRIKSICIENNIDYNGKLIPIKGEIIPMIQKINSSKIYRTFNFKFS